MSAAVCARCGVPASKRIRWFVMGRSMPMFDVCAHHLEVEQRTADLLNRGRPSPQLWVRVTDLPEQLQLRASRRVARVDRLAVLFLYRSCRERDMRPWEALEYVRTQASAARSDPFRRRRILAYIDRDLQPVVDRWFAENAREAARVDGYLKAPDVLAQLAELRAAGG